MTRSIIGVVAVATALALTACGGSSDKGSAPGTSSAASAGPTSTTPSSTSAAPTSSADTTAPSSAPTPATATSTRSMTASPQSTIPGDSTATGTATSSGTAGSTAPAGALDTAIRQYSFGNATFVTAWPGKMTLHGGTATLPGEEEGNPIYVGLQGTSQSAGTRKGFYYGDVNHDGIEDAIVELDIVQGNRVSIEYSVWIGSKNGSVRQLGQPFITMGRCGKDIKSITISPDGVITVSGGRGGTSCAEQGTGAPYVARYAVRGDQVVTLVAPPRSD